MAGEWVRLLPLVAGRGGGPILSCERGGGGGGFSSGLRLALPLPSSSELTGAADVGTREASMVLDFRFGAGWSFVVVLPMMLRGVAGFFFFVARRARETVFWGSWFDISTSRPGSIGEVAAELGAVLVKKTARCWYWCWCWC